MKKKKVFLTISACFYFLLLVVGRYNLWSHWHNTMILFVPKKVQIVPKIGCRRMLNPVGTCNVWFGVLLYLVFTRLFSLF